MPSKREKLKQLFHSEISMPCKNLDISQNHTFVSDLGKGNPNSKIIFCGEAPGKKEDAKGIPFVGRAGKIFHENLKRIGLKREEIWVSNVVKYRPTEDESRNRRPKKDEIEKCLPIMKKEIEIINPEIIVTLGSIPLNALKEENYKITEVSGKKLDYEGRILFPTFHPAAAMRFKKYRKQFEENFNSLAKIIKNYQ